MIARSALTKVLFFGFSCTVALGVCYADSSLPSDVQVALSADNTRNLKTGDVIEFTMTVRNNGPQTIGYFSIVGPEVFTEFHQPGLNWNDCAMLTDTGDSDFGPFWQLVWYPSGLTLENPVAPGDERVCHFELTVAPGLPAQYPFTVRLGTYFTDTDSANNTATVQLRRTVTQVPSLSRLSLILLSLLIIGSASQRPVDRRETLRFY